MKRSEIDPTYKKFLDTLRESGEVNMYGAGPLLRQEFPELDKQQAKEIIIAYVHAEKEERL